METGNWKNRMEKETNVISWLGEIDYSSGKMEYHKNKDKKTLNCYKVEEK
jgi:hypothetical protein